MSTDLEESTFGTFAKKFKPLLSAKIHKQQVTFAKNVKNKIKLTVNEAINSIDNLDINKEADKRTMFSELNVFFRDINEALFNLRLLHQNEQKQSNSLVELLDVINQLVEISDGVKNGFCLDSNSQEKNFKNSTKKVDIVSEKLLEAIEEDELCRKYKQELVDLLSDLLSTVERVKVRNKIRNFNLEEMKLYLSNAKIEVIEVLRSIKSENELVLCYLIHHFLRGCLHMLKALHHLQKYGKQYELKIYKTINDTANTLNDALENIQKFSRTCDSTATISPELQENLFRGYTAFEELLKVLSDEYVQQGIGDTNLRGTVEFVTVETLVNGFQLRRGLVDTALYA